MLVNPPSLKLFTQQQQSRGGTRKLPDLDKRKEKRPPPKRRSLLILRSVACSRLATTQQREATECQEAEAGRLRNNAVLTEHLRAR